MDWLAFKILILFYETDSFLIYSVIMDFQKMSKSWNLAYLILHQAQKQCSKFQNFGLSTKKAIETQKCTQAAWPPLVLPIFNLPQQLKRCHNFWTSYQFVLKFSGKSYLIYTFYLQKFHQNLRSVMSQPLKFWSIWHGMTQET